MVNDEVVFAPASPEQERFLTTDVDFAFYGGELCASIQNLFNSVKP